MLDDEDSYFWGFENCEIVERVHLKFCKALKSSTPSFMVNSIDTIW
jgi:hypothetical protein